MVNVANLTGEKLAEEACKILQLLSNNGGQSTVDVFQQMDCLNLGISPTDYLHFLSEKGYLSLDNTQQQASMTAEGQQVLSGDRFIELLEDAESHFRNWENNEPSADQRPPSNATATIAGEQSSPHTQATDENREAHKLEKHADRYERQEILGSGGLGVVHLGRQRSLNRDVAIKEIKDIFKYFTARQKQDVINKLQQVVWENASLVAPGIVTILDMDLTDEYPYYVMEYVPNGNLRSLLKGSNERLPVAKAVKYFVQVAEAVAYAHRQNILHRNLKPENVLIDIHGNAKVADFGLSQIVEQKDGSNTPQMFMGMGTVAYMAPEQFQEPGKATFQSDLYSLGIMLYEMLTGKLPGRRSPMPHAYYEDIPMELDDIFDRMTMDFMNVRYASLDEMLSDLYACGAITSLLGPRESVPASASKDDAPKAAASSAAPAAPYQPVSEPEPEAEIKDSLLSTPQAQEAAPEPNPEPVAEPAPEPVSNPSDNGDGVSNRLDSLASDLFDD